MAGVAIWSEALDATAIAALHAKGNEAIRPTITLHLRRRGQCASSMEQISQLVRGGHWQRAAADGITLAFFSNDTNYAEVAVNGLAPSTVYWCRCVIAEENGTVGHLRIEGGAGGFSAPGGGDVVIPAGVGTKYFQVETDEWDRALQPGGRS